jgi:hypothetical protein
VNNGSRVVVVARMVVVVVVDVEAVLESGGGAPAERCGWLVLHEAANSAATITR